MKKVQNRATAEEQRKQKGGISGIKNRVIGVGEKIEVRPVGLGEKHLKPVGLGEKKRRYESRAQA